MAAAAPRHIERSSRKSLVLKLVRFVVCYVPRVALSGRHPENTL